jgi:DNA polymerase III delta subunit
VVTIILGPDGFLARNALMAHRAKLDPDGLNTDLIDGRAASADEIARIVNTPAFFGGPRTVVIDGFLERFGKKSAAEGDSPARVKALPDATALAAVFSGAANTVFFDATLASLPAAVKKAAPKEAEVLAHEAPRGHELIRWMRAQAEAGGADLPEPLARKLAELLFPKTWSAKPSNPAYDRPPELERLANEIDKLTLASHPGAITAALIDEMVATSQEDRLFPLIEAIYAGENSVALKELEAARERGDDPSRLANSLYQQAELAAAVAPGRNLAEVGQELGLANPNRMFGVAKSSQRSRRPAAAWVGRLVAIERGVKSGELRDPWDPLYAALDSSK